MHILSQNGHLETGRSWEYDDPYEITEARHLVNKFIKLSNNYY